jgi:hypothetical protein
MRSLRPEASGIHALRVDIGPKERRRANCREVCFQFPTGLSAEQQMRTQELLSFSF